MGTDDDIIRNGTPRQWWNYYVVLGGKQESGYTKIEGGIRIKGKYLVIAVVLLAFIAGTAWF